MASGHINRANRPNTWLHRPACRREEKPCQLGAVHTWHKADKSRRLAIWPLLGAERTSGKPVRTADRKALELFAARDNLRWQRQLGPLWNFRAVGFCLWQRALSRSRPSRGLRGPRLRGPRSIHRAPSPSSCPSAPSTVVAQPRYEEWGNEHGQRAAFDPNSTRRLPWHRDRCRAFVSGWGHGL